MCLPTRVRLPSAIFNNGDDDGAYPDEIAFSGQWQLGEDKHLTSAMRGYIFVRRQRARGLVRRALLSDAKPTQFHPKRGRIPTA